MKYLFLDDERFPNQVNWVKLPRIPVREWAIVRNYEEFIYFIAKNGLPDYISFDNDLGEPEAKTGYDALCWLIEHCLTNNLNLPELQFHTMNHVAKKKMAAAYYNYYEIKDRF